MDAPSTRRAVVLLSGGLDSATTLAVAKSQNCDCFALSFNYGQRHSFELECAKRLAVAFDVMDHVILDVDLRKFGGSALTTDIPVPRSNMLTVAREIPITYVPARNTIFLSLALAYAEVVEALDIFIGVNALDYSGYPDCRPEYLDAFQKMAALATKSGVEGSPVSICAPLVRMTKAEIINKGMELGVNFAMTSSCYIADGEGRACGECDSCTLRKKGFAEAGLDDPIQYADAK
jgi:7-cyano-7-deazaguanine synthase